MTRHSGMSTTAQLAKKSYQQAEVLGVAAP
jgi:hypothetical protein